MPGIFNSAIFNNQVFNTGDVQKGGGAWREEYHRAQLEQKNINLRLEVEKTQKQIVRVDTKISKIEQQRLTDLANENLQRKLLAYAKEAEALRIARANLQRELGLLTDDDDIVFLLLTAAKIYC